jgi:hypothetical protein
MAPGSQMLSSNMLTNSLSVFRPLSSSTNDSRPTKIWAAVTPQPTAGVSLKTMSVATGSFRCLTLQAGKRERQCCFNVTETRPQAYWVVTLNVCLMVPEGAQPKSGRSNSNFGATWET